VPFVQTPRVQQLIALVSKRRPAGATRLKPPTQPQPQLGYPWEFNCHALEVEDIRRTIDRMHLEYLPQINGMGGAGIELANRLAGLTEDSIRLDCRKDCPAPNNSQSGAIANAQTVKFFMNICAGTAPPNSASRRSLVRALVFMELIRLCGGNAVDVYGLYAYFVKTTRNGPPPIDWMAPTPNEMLLMCAEGRRLVSPYPPYTTTQWLAGTFMCWNNVAGIYRVGNQVNPTLATINPLDFPSLGLTTWRQTMNCP
jgi:hypothetical protein